MKVTPKTIHQKMVKQQAIELLDHLTVDEACVYLDKNCKEDERSALQFFLVIVKNRAIKLQVFRERVRVVLAVRHVFHCVY